MPITRTTATAAVVAIAALALPATAAAHADPSLGSARAHAERAGTWLDRAIDRAELERSQRAVRSAYERSRTELARARHDAAQLRKEADGAAERGRAARALAEVAEQQGENVAQLAAALADARGSVERSMASAARADAKGRDQAIAVIAGLLEDGVPPQAARGLTRALEALSTERDQEVEALAKALAGEAIAERSKTRLAGAARQSVNGQAGAVATLEGLLASDRVPEQGKEGLRRAMAAVLGEQAKAARALSAYAAAMPEDVRGFVGGILKQAFEDAQGLVGTLPALPGGAPADLPKVPGVPSVPVPQIPVPDLAPVTGLGGGGR